MRELVFPVVRLRRLNRSRERRSAPEGESDEHTAGDPLSQRILRLADGDGSAFDDVYDVVGPRVDALCVRLLGPGPDAEDAAQQTLIRVFERVDQYDPAIGPALGWILGLAVWEARTVRRRRGRRREDPWGEAPIPMEVAMPVDDDGWAEVNDAIATLRPVDREVVLAVLGRGPRPQTTPAAFRKRVQRVVERIRATLGRSR